MELSSFSCCQFIGLGHSRSSAGSRIESKKGCASACFTEIRVDSLKSYQSPPTRILTNIRDSRSQRSGGMK